MIQRVLAAIRRWRMKTLKSFGAGPSAGCVRISFCDLNPLVTQAIASGFADVDAAEVVEGNLLELSCDALVSPANSFGDMSGGIDKAIDDFHKGAAQQAVRAAIAEQFFGELPV